MNSIVNCPGCGFRGRLPDGLAGLKTIICPQCKINVAIDSLRRVAVPAEDASHPIWVDNTPGQRIATNVPRVLVDTPVEEETYAGDYMKDEAARFAQYVAARLSELHKRRLELTEAENRFEQITMEKKQEIARQRGAVGAEAETLKQREAALQAEKTSLVSRESELATREAEVASREGRVARSEARATDTDRRTAELRAAIDALEARRAAVAEERVELDRRAEAMDRAELALHRRSAELDELDERLRLEQEEFEREKDEFEREKEQILALLAQRVASVTNEQT
jgi:hypothetical protein